MVSSAALPACCLVALVLIFNAEILERSGGNMQMWAQDKALKTKVIAIHAVAKAIQFLHERSILHRDIKPANVVFEGKRTTRFLGFAACPGLLSHEADCTSCFIAALPYLIQ